MDTLVRIAGEAGRGVQTTGQILVNALARIGLHVFATQSYLSRVRGGVNWYDIRIADHELFAGRSQADLLIALTDESLVALREQTEADGVIVFDGEADPGVVSIGFLEAAKQLVQASVMANAVAAGSVFTLLGYDIERLCACLEEQFRGKGSDVVDANVRCARRGAELAAAHAGSVEAPSIGDAPKTVMGGSAAVGLGAATAGLKFATGYPMSPSTGTLTSLAGLTDEYGIVVEQAEDEIAAINMVCGATYAGVPAMTTTSGGGFALMGEGLSLAGMLELPVVVMVGQRPGPATGLPTRTAQQDLLLALHAGHGEFPRALYAPGTIQQAYELTRRAMQTAHTYQTPVILLTDQFLADQQKTIPPLSRRLRPVDRCVVGDPSPDYVRYADTPSGISPRALPGSAAFVIVDSDEHDEIGHITEDLATRLRMQDKRMRKLRGMIQDSLPPVRYGPEVAETVLIAWGSTYGPCREAVDLLNDRGRRVAMVHFCQVWPLDPDSVKAILVGPGQEAEGSTRFLSVECNQTGQFASVLREQGILAHCGLISKYDGMPYTAVEIARRVSS